MQCLVVVMAFHRYCRTRDHFSGDEELSDGVVVNGVLLRHSFLVIVGLTVRFIVFIKS